MNRTASLFLIGFVLAAGLASAQDRRMLGHEDYARWKAVSDETLSRDGAWAAWREAPDTVGDGLVVVRSTDGATTFRVARGDAPRFSADGRWLVAMIRPPYDAVRQAKIDGKKGDDLPKDSVAVLDLATGSVAMYGPARSFRLPEKAGAVLAILMDAESKPDSAATAAAADGPKHKKQNGRRLEARRLDDGAAATFEFVVDYRFTDDGRWLAYTAESKDGSADGAFAVATGALTAVPLKTGAGHYRQLAVDDVGVQAAFVSNADDFAADQPAFILYRGRLGGGATAAAREADLPDGWWVSENGSLDFSDSGRRLFFGAAPRPAREDTTKVPDDEKVAVDIWNWREPVLQTVQLNNRERDLKRSFSAVVRADGRVVLLADEALPTVRPAGTGDEPTFTGTTNVPYSVDNDWEYPNANDVYLVDAESGRRTLVLEGIQSSVHPSPDGACLAWWDGHAKAWKMTHRTTKPDAVVTRDLTSALPVRFDDELHDSPAIPSAYGQAGWTTDGTRFVAYDRNDVWAFPRDKGAENLTAGNGLEQGLRYRIVDLDPDADGVDLTAPVLLSVFDLASRSSGFAAIEPARDGMRRQDLLMEPAAFGRPAKAAEADRLLLTRESFRDFPDLYTTDFGFGAMTRLSDANPQQSEYRWGTVELVRWTSTDGDRLEGMLYKPDDFDPQRPYPMIVYFYERNSDRLHDYHTINPGRSVIGRSFYTSRGYVVFVPDIPYKDGYPGESAMNAVMPGVTMLIDQGIADPERIGVQGHSWGGYQIAYMVTRTNLFRAAAGGAPVANMISAYGGIRWGTGLSRQFQYERTQSRIGGSLWEKPLRYIENSPIFWADKIETPLLIMHNDEDAAVPWYQGVEMFMALRRLDKPAWLINYNGEVHWPQPYWKRVDWQMRLQQFFDHYLMDAPAPVWLSDGVPAVDKGRTMGLELPPADGNR